jgi:2-polyprenyl-6-hydroxyphenyl methylase/3-demethylubiquinone-9 3-methyltransferase
MSKWRDIVDWVGGYPFEVAKPEEVFEFCRVRGFELENLETQGGSLGCNQFLFRRREPASSLPPRNASLSANSISDTLCARKDKS